jgi:endonuclease/exonuclease/phosphatase family metal-dependent hydrolase
MTSEIIERVKSSRNASHKGFCICSVILFVLVISASGSCGKDATLTIMSWNIRTGNALDGGNAWKFREELVVETIRQCAPDILCSQESLDFQIDYMASSLPDYGWLGVGRDTNGGGEHMAVFYKREKLLPLESGNFWLSETPEVPGSKSWGSIWPRMVTWARFYNIQSAKSFYVFNTHFPALSEGARQKSAELIIQKISGLPPHPVIITGDFNSPAAKSPSWNLFSAAGFSDARLVAKKTIGPETTYGHFKPPGRDTKNRIDWILFRGTIQCEMLETVLYNKEGRYPSDHYALVARLFLSKTGSVEKGIRRD